VLRARAQFGLRDDSQRDLSVMQLLKEADAIQEPS
jgi:hypothetical protein